MVSQLADSFNTDPLTVLFTTIDSRQAISDKPREHLDHKSMLAS